MSDGKQQSLVVNESWVWRGQGCQWGSDDAKGWGNLVSECTVVVGTEMGLELELVVVAGTGLGF